MLRICVVIPAAVSAAVDPAPGSEKRLGNHLKYIEEILEVCVSHHRHKETREKRRHFLISGNSTR